MIAAAPDTTTDTTEVLGQLGTALVEHGAIDRRSLDRACRLAAETGGRLDRILTQLGILSERTLAESLAELLKIPLVHPAQYPDEPLFPDRLKGKFLRRARVMPIEADGDRLTLAMVDPLDRFTRQAVAAALGRPVNPAVAVPVDIEAALERLYAEPETADSSGFSTRSFPTGSPPRRTPKG